MSKDQGTEGEKRWPELELTEGEVFYLTGRLPSEPTGCETYVPVSSPRCLSKEEARLVVDNLATIRNTTTDLMPLFDRLKDWAGEKRWTISVCPKCGAQESDPPSDCVHCEIDGAQLTSMEVIPLTELISERAVDAFCSILDRDHDIQLTGWWTGHAILTAFVAALSPEEER